MIILFSLDFRCLGKASIMIRAFCMDRRVCSFPQIIKELYYLCDFLCLWYYECDFMVLGKKLQQNVCYSEGKQYLCTAFMQKLNH